VRKVLTLLAVSVVLSSCASGGATPENGSSAGGDATPLPGTVTPLPENATTGARIRARGYLLAGVRYDLEPFGFIDDIGNPAGFDVELARELARRWLGDEQAVAFRQVRSDTAYRHLHSGDVDIVLAALPHTAGGEAEVDFGPPYFIDGQALLVRASDAEAIGGLAQLEYLSIGVDGWSDAEEAIRATVTYTPTIVSFSRFDAAVDALGRGDVDAVADERHRLLWGQRMLPQSVIVGQYTEEPLAYAIPQNDPFFADLVNLTFQEIVADGTYSELYARWFGGEPAGDLECWPGEAVPDLVDAPTVSSAPDTIASITARGHLLAVLAAERYPFAYLGGGGAPVGYEVRLLELMAEIWLGDSGVLEFVMVDAGSGVELVSSGQADLLIGGVAHSRDAELELDFALTTYVSGESLLVEAGTAIQGLEGLQGMQVGSVSDGTSGDTLLSLANQAGVQLTVLAYPSLDDAIEALRAEEIAAIVADRSDLLYTADNTAGLEVLDWRLTEVPIALGLPPGDSAFRDLVNLTLQSLAADGTLEALYTIWFDDEPLEVRAWPGTAYRSLLLETADELE
jgi:putative glutamine transport system substrate-binding protein